MGRISALEKESMGTVSFLDADLVEDARALVREIARRLENPYEVESIVRRRDNVEPVYGSSMWVGGSLSHGLAGTAMLHAVISHHEPSCARVTREHLEGAVRQLRWDPNAGLMSGPAGVLATAQEAGANTGSYPRLRMRLGEYVAKTQCDLVTKYRERINDGIDWNAYDLMNGLSGRLRILLDEQSEAAEYASRKTLDFFCDHILSIHDGLPGWWVPARLQPTEDDRRAYPHGDLNLGQAHGVAGVLGALVAGAGAFGLSPTIRDALVLGAEWIRSWRQTTGNTTFWPARVPAEYELNRASAPPLFTRAAWCYGTPGVAISVIRAGVLLDDQHLVSSAVETLLSHLSLPERQWKLDGPTFCHGSAGVIAVLFRCWKETRDPRLRELGNSLARRLMYDMAEWDSAFLYRHWVPDSPLGWRNATSHRHLDCAGILEGAAGVALVLDTVSRPYPYGCGSSWDRVFGLS